MKIIEIEWCSPEYQSALELRHDVLREPLGLKLTAEELDGEHAQLHFGAFDNDELVATIVARPQSSGIVQFRQMAVRSDRQRCGVGSELLKSCETRLRELGFSEAFLHAREACVPFYEKLGYQPVGDEFELISLKHQKMSKSLA
ncbi:GNAT family N-acetyltransferase [Aporhodopirellula aestuarii]|uniref:GNAT family N-acetyltransferase n=1 Tax=Aporhodopirellula aestuarii TaxID=2950107 RepID=A0ABT0U6N9_9BACT|nr:GNAT family N-acetyltransferase [Aporhodopirellula aestuarii]MCM2372590.1 GNAT family N-acetyltransferase [Aporhodopirellula aestuarii]